MITKKKLRDQNTSFVIYLHEIECRSSAIRAAHFECALVYCIYILTSRMALFKLQQVKRINIIYDHRTSLASIFFKAIAKKIDAISETKVSN